MVRVTRQGWLRGEGGRWDRLHDKVTSNRNATQRENLAPVSEELGSVVNDALADGLKILDLAVAKVRQEMTQPVDILVFLLLLKVAVSTKLEEDLVI